MCNSDRVLKSSAVTAMIDHENDDRGKTNLIGYQITAPPPPPAQAPSPEYSVNRFLNLSMVEIRNCQ